MAAISDYLEDALLDHVFNATPYTSPVQVFVGLFTTATSDTGGGTEVSGGGYVRQAASFGPASNGQVVTDADITFPVATGNWGIVTHVGLYDALAAGNLLFHGSLVAARTVNTGDTFKFNAGDLVAALD